MHRRRTARVRAWEHAEDLRLLIEALDTGPADIFGSSGAVNALATVAAHPRLVRALVAHEPPAAMNCGP